MGICKFLNFENSELISKFGTCVTGRKWTGSLMVKTPTRSMGDRGVRSPQLVHIFTYGHILFPLNNS